MGYAVPSQRGEGIHTRQYARTFIVQDSAGRRAVYSSVDISAISHAMRRDVNFSAFQPLNLFLSTAYYPLPGDSKRTVESWKHLQYQQRHVGGSA